MNSKGAPGIRRIAVLTLVIGVATTGGAWGQQAISLNPETSSTTAPAEDRPVASALATAAAVIGSFFYIPFKIGAICPGMLLASGVSLAVTGGDKARAEYLLRAGCAGTYFITPAMVRGQEEFQASGERQPEGSQR